MRNELILFGFDVANILFFMLVSLSILVFKLTDK